MKLRPTPNIDATIAPLLLFPLHSPTFSAASSHDCCCHHHLPITHLSLQSALQPRPILYYSTLYYCAYTIAPTPLRLYYCTYTLLYYCAYSIASFSSLRCGRILDKALASDYALLYYAILYFIMLYYTLLRYIIAFFHKILARVAGLHLRFCSSHCSRIFQRGQRLLITPRCFIRTPSAVEVAAR